MVSNFFFELSLSEKFELAKIPIANHIGIYIHLNLTSMCGFRLPPPPPPVHFTKSSVFFIYLGMTPTWLASALNVGRSDWYAKADWPSSEHDQNENAHCNEKLVCLRWKPDERGGKEKETEKSFHGNGRLVPAKKLAVSKTLWYVCFYVLVKL